MSLRLQNQREYRKANGNIHTKRYEKTKKGFLVRAYRNMKSRITGVQSQKFHLYSGLSLLDKEEFYTWALNNEVFHNLFDEWVSLSYLQKHTPSVDRINSKVGYELSNMEWVTHSENSRRGSNNRHVQTLDSA